jgi:WD40 repeat protein
VRAFERLDEDRLLSVGMEARAAVWRVREGTLDRELRPGWRHASDVSVLAGTSLAYVAANDGVHEWDIDEDASRRVFDLQGDAPTRVLCDPNGRWLVAGGGAGSIHVWNLRSGERLRAVVGDAGISAVCGYGADHILVGDGVGWVVEFAVPSLKLVGARREHAGAVSGLVPRSSGGFWSGSFDGTMQSWEGIDRSPTQRVVAHPAGLTSLTRWPAAQLLVSTGFDGRVRCWSTSLALASEFHLGARVYDCHAIGDTLVAGGASRRVAFLRRSRPE